MSEITDIVCPDCRKAFLELKDSILSCPVCKAQWREE